MVYGGSGLSETSPISIGAGVTFRTHIKDLHVGVGSAFLQVQNRSSIPIMIVIGPDEYAVSAAQATTLPLPGDGAGVDYVLTNSTAATVTGSQTFTWLLDGQLPPQPDGPLTDASSTGAGPPAITQIEPPPQFQAYTASGTGPLILSLYTITGSFVPSVTYPTGYGPQDYKTAIVEIDWTTSGASPLQCTTYVQDGTGSSEFFFSQFKAADSGTLTLVIPLPYAPTGGFPNLFVDLAIPGGKAWNVNVVFVPEMLDPDSNNNTWRTFDGVTPFPPVLLPPYEANLNPYGVIQLTNSVMPPYLLAIGAEYPGSSTIQPLQVTNSGLLRAILDSATGNPGSVAPSQAVLVGGTDATDLRALLTDSSGRLVLAPGSVATNVNATIVSPLDGSGFVEVDVKTSVLPTGAATSANQTLNLAAPGSPIPTDAALVGGSDGTDIRSLATDASGQLKVLIEGGTLPGPATPSNSNSAGNVTSLHIKSSAGTFYGLTGYSSIQQFLQLLDANSLSSGTTAPVVTLQVGPGSFALDYGSQGRAFATGIFAAFSSTETVFTTGTAGWLDAQYA